MIPNQGSEGYHYHYTFILTGSITWRDFIITCACRANFSPFSTSLLKQSTHKEEPPVTQSRWAAWFGLLLQRANTLDYHHNAYPNTIFIALARHVLMEEPPATQSRWAAWFGRFHFKAYHRTLLWTLHFQHSYSKGSAVTYQFTFSNAHNPQGLLPVGALLLRAHVLAQPTGLRCP